jgi:CRISPR/Cas system CMR subunit Cmr4 (Cas7 group RAMP superfamily)
MHKFQLEHIEFGGLPEVGFGMVKLEVLREVLLDF